MSETDSWHWSETMNNCATVIWIHLNTKPAQTSQLKTPFQPWSPKRAAVSNQVSKKWTCFHVMQHHRSEMFVRLKYQSAVDKDKWKNSRFYLLISGSAGEAKCRLSQSIILHDVYCLSAAALIIQQSRCRAYTIISTTAWGKKRHNVLFCVLKSCPLLAPLILHTPCEDGWQFGCWKRQTAQVERGAWTNSTNTQGGGPTSYGGCLSMTAGIKILPTL